MTNAEYRGKLITQAPLARYTTWKVGGAADYLYQAADLQDLQQFLRALPDMQPITWLGLGSNTLIRDAGIPGSVILTLGALQRITMEDDLVLRIEAGVSCASAARFAARHGWRGIEFLAGVPGTIGGALRMNAGCFGGETWAHVCHVETINRRGDVQLRQPDEFEIAYRQVQGLQPDEWFVGGYFRLTSGDKDQALACIKELLARRAHTQPTNQPTCGSVFRNPENNYAARLIETCGLKGFVHGGARVSPKHANFIENQGQATAENIEELIKHVADVVLEKHGVQLEREVHILGKKSCKKK